VPHYGGVKLTIRARVRTLTGYSAHADQGRTAGMSRSDEAAAREDKAGTRREKGPTGPGRGAGKPGLSGDLSFSDHRLTRIDANSGKGSWLAEATKIPDDAETNKNSRRCSNCHQISTYQFKNA